LVVADPLNAIRESDETNNVAPVRYRVFNQQEFLSLYQQEFGNITQSQRIGLNTLLSFVELDRYMNDPRWIAYMLATTKLETGNTYLATADEGVLANGAKVRLSYFNKYAPGTRLGKKLGNTEKGDGYLFRGRGYVQLTGRHLYTALGTVLGYGLAANPDLAFRPIIAYNVISYGMRNGTFTGVGRNRFINDQTTDYLNARKIINSLNQAPKIEGYAKKFAIAIQGSINM